MRKKSKKGRKKPYGNTRDAYKESYSKKSQYKKRKSKKKASFGIFRDFAINEIDELLPQNCKVGTMRKNKKGFGFVILDKPDTEEYNPDEYKDVYVRGYDMNGAMNGDIVEVNIYPAREGEDSKRGIVRKVVSRKIKEVAGSLDVKDTYGFVKPEGKSMNEDIFIPGNMLGHAKHGDYVLAQITKYPDGNNKAEGMIVEVLASAKAPGADIVSMIKNAGLEITFPAEVKKEATSIENKVCKAEIEKRRDLRDMVTVTIDGADSKDFDDAVSININENGNWVLWVHIADVSHYVKPNSPLDVEALKRGNSVYLINQVVPMLPKKLSNGICSLNPGVDRLTLTCEMEITKEGKVVNHDIYESVINSNARLVYDDVSDILESNSVTLENEFLFEMEKLAKVLMNRKKARGALEFDLDEAVILLDKKGRAVDISKADRRISNKIIEEFMLLANETVAEHFFWLNVPFVYRAHPGPSVANYEDLVGYLRKLNINIRGDVNDVKPSYLANVLEQAKGTKYESIVNTQVLQSMQKAYYDVECVGHFGLALQYYCHFTSPIRRYPDLMIHRIIKLILHNRLTDNLLGKLEKQCEIAAEQSSKTELHAVELEREVIKMKMCEYMEDHIGEKYYGTVSGVASFGMFVSLDDSAIEGLVRLNKIPGDFYDFDQDNYRIIGRGSGKSYSIGDRVRVKVEKVVVVNREINFSLIANVKK